MEMDSTALGIACGVIGSGIFAFLEIVIHRRHRRNRIDTARNIALVFFSILAIFSGGELIFVAFQGDPDNLPPTWRQYLALAGVVGVGLAFDYSIRIAQGILERVPESGNQRDDK
uniref:Uncharacterized protein n=1 Tax=Candidatus Kentrum sp. LFY TaxID=2126342 RepID=A0A450U9I9_9GAMM|nr:MAG: hypothetical protein BECKLFY1418A_GA0070994_100542 [Candidatus Kentron sp. LFY]